VAVHLLKALCVLYENTLEKDGETDMWKQAGLSVWNYQN